MLHDKSVAAEPRRAAPNSPAGRRRVPPNPVPSPSTLSGSIVATIKERVINWQYPPEYRLTEEALCREFNVSRSPVREALRILATNGLIKRTPNRGYAVRQVSPKEVEEIYDVRLALELFSVEALAQSGVPSGALNPLAETWDNLSRAEAVPTDEALAELDAKFHESLVQLTGNATLLRELKAVNERLLVFRMIDFGRVDRVASTCAQHLAILERIKAGDGEGARAALRANVEEARKIVHATFKDALARAYATV